jgi:hypothetical protein
MRDGAANSSPWTSPPQSDSQSLTGASDHEDYPLELMVADTSVAASSYETLPALAEAGQYDEEEGPYLIARGRPDQPFLTDSHTSRRDRNGLLSSQPASPAVLRWLNGPDPPRIYRIQSSEWLQAAGDRLLDKCCPSRWLKLSLLLLLYALWAGMFVSALPRSVGGSNDSDAETPARLSCTSQLWYGYPRE